MGGRDQIYSAQHRGGKRRAFREEQPSAGCAIFIESFGIVGQKRITKRFFDVFAFCAKKIAKKFIFFLKKLLTKWKLRDIIIYVG